jgi:hypothetical protein
MSEFGGLSVNTACGPISSKAKPTYKESKKRGGKSAPLATTQYQAALAIQIFELPLVFDIGLWEILMQDFHHAITHEKQNYRNRQARYD